jgi:hypothetical protein
VIFSPQKRWHRKGMRLTNGQERFILKKVKNKILSVAVLFLFLSLFLSSPRAKSSQVSAKNMLSNPQESPIKKPRYDYMSTFLSRNTKPLGLKEDLLSKKLLSQPLIKWAIRAGERHILD